jgi:hypothetical protein
MRPLGEKGQENFNGCGSRYLLDIVPITLIIRQIGALETVRKCRLVSESKPLGLRIKGTA